MASGETNEVLTQINRGEAKVSQAQFSTGLSTWVKEVRTRTLQTWIRC